MKQLCLIIVCSMLMFGCHSSKQSTTSIETSTVSNESLYLDKEMLNCFSLSKRLSVTFDSLDLSIEPILPPQCQSDSTADIRSDCSPAYRLHIKANQARIDNSSVAESDTYNHTLLKDSSMLRQTSAQLTSENRDSIIVAKPPEYSIIAIVIFLGIFAFVVFYLRYKINS